MFVAIYFTPTSVFRNYEQLEPPVPSAQVPKPPSSLVLLAHSRCPEVADCKLLFKMCSCSTDDDVGVTAREHAVGNATEHDGVVATEHGGVAATEHGLSTGCYRARSFHRHQCQQLLSQTYCNWSKCSVSISWPFHELQLS